MFITTEQQPAIPLLVKERTVWLNTTEILLVRGMKIYKRNTGVRLRNVAHSIATSLYNIAQIVAHDIATLRHLRPRHVRHWLGGTTRHIILTTKSLGRRRLIYLGATMLMVWTVFIPLYNVLFELNLYNLDTSQEALVGETNPNLTLKLTESRLSDSYFFNQEGLGIQTEQLAEAQGTSEEDASAALAGLKSQIGGGGKKDQSLYSVKMPEKASDGFTYYDNVTNLKFKLTSEDYTQAGKKWEGRMVYPMANGMKAVYTPKTNGLKEDIVLTKPVADEMSFSYQLDLPVELEARLQQDGSVGIFSADIALYSAETTNAEDRAKILDARKSAEKTNLVFGLPKPEIIDNKGERSYGSFSLAGDTLIVRAFGLNKMSYPLSVDPSVVIDSSSDFRSGGNNEGDINFNTADQITGMTPSGGTLAAWGTTTAVGSGTAGTGNYGMASVAYNGFMYVLGGGTVEQGNTGATAYAAINSNGTLGTWTAGTSLDPTGGHGYGLSAVAYNGYIYAMGGQYNTQLVEYAALDPTTGAIGSWQTTTTLPGARFAAGAAAYNGYVYLVGGYGGGTLSSVIYAKINANGTLGSWQTTTAMTDTRATLGVFVYNDYLYAVGGYRDENNAQYSATLFAKISSTGTVGSWMTTSSVSQAGAGLGVTVANGYAYAFGGSTGPTPGYAYGTTRAEYAQINANGELGTWRSLTALGTATTNTAAVSYNGYVYVVGGRNATSSPVAHDLVQYASANPAGATTAWASGTSVGTARAGVCTVIYNNYIYAIGGSTTNSLTGRVTTVEYASINTTTGVIGTWATTTALAASRTQAGCTAHNGRLYVVGGADPDNTYTATTRYITINTNGTLAASWTNGTSLANAMLTRGLYTHTLPNGTTNLYALGNYNSTGTNEVEYAPINTNGSIGTWTASGNVPTSANAPAFAKVGNYLYAMGGANSTYTGTYNTVQYATINTNGTVSAWSTTTSLPAQRGFAYGVTVNGCIYSLAGYDNSIAVTNSAYYACPAANGTISTWNTAPNLGTAKYNTAATSYNGYIYIVGGGTNTSGAVTAATEYTKVNNGGGGGAAGGAWVTDSDIAVVDNRFRHATVVHNGYVYSIGGSVNGGGNITTQTVEYAAINADGTLGAWAADTHEIPSARVFPAAAAYNGYMYLLGGQESVGGAFLKTISYAPISSTGALSGNWASAGGNTTNGGTGASLVAYNGYLYSIGGYDGTVDYNTVQYAPINSNGTIGSWTTNANSFTTARSNLSPFVYNGYMYIAGGEGASLMNDIQVAQINSDGTLGSWAYTTPFTGARKDTVATAYNGFVYITGGNDSTSSLADVQFAPILSGGIIGPWQRAFAPINGDPVGARSPSGQAIWNGRLYRAGGAALNGSSSTTMSGAKFLELDSISRVARYSKLVTLPSSYGSNVNVGFNGTFNLDSRVDFRTAGTDYIIGTTQTSATIGSGTDPAGVCSVGGNTINYVAVSALIDDSRKATFGSGTPSNITDITVNYSVSGRAPTQLRLHGGKWFRDGALAPLDTCV